MLRQHEGAAGSYSYVNCSFVVVFPLLHSLSASCLNIIIPFITKRLLQKWFKSHDDIVFAAINAVLWKTKTMPMIIIAFMIALTNHSLQIINVWMSVLLSVQKNLKTSGRKEEWCRESAVWISCGGRQTLWRLGERLGRWENSNQRSQVRQHLPINISPESKPWHWNAATAK